MVCKTIAAVTSVAERKLFDRNHLVKHVKLIAPFLVHPVNFSPLSSPPSKFLSLYLVHPVNLFSSILPISSPPSENLLASLYQLNFLLLNSYTDDDHSLYSISFCGNLTSVCWISVKEIYPLFPEHLGEVRGSWFSVLL